MNSRTDHLVGVALILASTVGWSLTGYFTRLIALDTVTLIAWRGLLGAVCVIGVTIALRGHQWRNEFKIWGKLPLLYIANSTATAVMLFTAFAYTSVAHVVVIFSTIPLVAALLGWLFLAELPARSAVGASLVAVAGVSVMVALGSDGGLLGDALALGMTIATTFTIILIRRFPSIPVLGCSAASLALMGVLVLPFANHGVISEQQMWQLALFASTNSVVGVAFYALGAKRIPAVEVGLLSTLDLPLSVVWVWIAFGEQPSTHTLIGGAGVLGAVIYYILASSRRRRLAIV
jgi:drug/metabolite transporter (DMT)-like permease